MIFNYNSKEGQKRMRIWKTIKVNAHECRKKMAREETPPRYIIQGVGDFSDVPPEKWPLFIENFELFLGVHRAMKKDLGRKFVVVDEYVWTDDGKNVGHVIQGGKS